MIRKQSAFRISPSITEIRKIITCQESDGKETNQHDFQIVCLHFQIFKTCVNLEIDFSITVNKCDSYQYVRNYTTFC